MKVILYIFLSVLIMFIIQGMCLNYKIGKHIYNEINQEKHKIEREKLKRKLYYDRWNNSIK